MEKAARLLAAAQALVPHHHTLLHHEPLSSQIVHLPPQNHGMDMIEDQVY